jgi:exportin-2 (importin alpha re-exporter)
MTNYFPAIMRLLLNRLQSSRTEKFTIAFITFVAFLFGTDNIQGGPDATIKVFEAIQPG